ncbi:MAG: efflux RND transporter periplasmic adaptor subunit, partial [Myxococcales bacterium]|nr:efflux RND transporter periplasmic adaptor subunit [Myxococcales bacterium]
GAPAEIHARAGDAVAAAQSLAGASDLAVARRHFADLSAALLALVSADPRLAEGRRIYECTMTDGFNRWIQPDGDDLANPYKGAAMQTCGAPLTLDEVFAAGADAPLDDPDAVDHWTCPMHPWVHQQGPGTCPVCGMELTPVTAEEVRSGVIRVEGERRQEIGVRVQPIARAPMTIAIRAVGLVAYDERSQADVSLKFGGWIERLYVNETGQRVRAGQTLFTIYSPEVYAAQQEWLLALDARDAARDDVNRRRADAMVAAARRRLELWDLGAATLDKIAAKHAPLQYVPIAAPASGYVVDKDVVAGAAVDAGHRLFRIAALDRVWVEAQIYEQDLAEVKVGQPARVTLGHLPGKIFEGKVTFVAPSLDAGTRTASVRIELPNRDLALRPNMYASVELTTDVGERLQVPESAIIYSGPRRIVFVDLGGDRLAPRQVTLGLKAGSAYEVLSGLEAGDQVVVSGNFLLASESRLKSATGLW